MADRSAGLDRSATEKLICGLALLYRDFHSVFTLKIIDCNANQCVSFSQASCATTKYQVKTSYPSFFQSTVAELLDKLPDDGAKMPEPRPELYESILNVMENNQDITRKLQDQIDDKQETAFSTQLAHHLLIPLSLHKEYTIDHHSRKQTMECVCCKEKIAGRFEDTSMGHEKLWHGSIDILIGRTKKVDEDKYSAISCFEIKTDGNLESFQNQLIAESVVFGHLQLNEIDTHSLIPTIAISKTQVKIYFYDALHDFLLESSSMPLWTPDRTELQYSTILALWLAINYHVTCTGLTKEIVKNGFTADFMKNFSEEIKEIYRKELHFKNCRKKSEKPRHYDYWPESISSPFKEGQRSLTEDDHKRCLDKYRNVLKKKEKK